MKALFDNPVLLIVVLLIIVLLFGAKKLPELAGSIAKSMNIFKAEAKAGKKSDDDDRDAPRSAASPTTESAAPRPLEGRVVDEPRREQGSYDSQQRHSA